MEMEQKQNRKQKQGKRKRKTEPEDKQRPKSKRIQEAQASKADEYEYISHSPAKVKGYTVTAKELAYLHKFDNECGMKYMQAPLRTCRVLDEKLAALPGEITLRCSNVFKPQIEKMWQLAATYYDISCDQKNKEAGYRVSVKRLGLKIETSHKINFGWLAEIPCEMLDDCGELKDWAHIFRRSWTDNADENSPRITNYLGGPASFMNWCPPDKVTAYLETGENHTVVRMSMKKNLPPGGELKWNYTNSSSKAGEHVLEKKTWFKECCSEITNIKKLPGALPKQQETKENERLTWYREKCVLCAKPYSIENAQNRPLRKHHFITNHADFFGSEWDGCQETFADFRETHNPQISREEVFKNADLLNQFLIGLKSRGWSYIPACKLFDQVTLDEYKKEPGKLLGEYAARKKMLELHGTLILRSWNSPSKDEHFLPIQANTLSGLPWKGEKPVSGQYAISTEQKMANKAEVKRLIANTVPKQAENENVVKARKKRESKK